MLTTFPQCNFSLEFSEILSQNHIRYHWLSVSGNSKIMHCGILINMPHSESDHLHFWALIRLTYHCYTWMLIIVTGRGENQRVECWSCISKVSVVATSKMLIHVIRVINLSYLLLLISWRWFIVPVFQSNHFYCSACATLA